MPYKPIEEPNGTFNVDHLIGDWSRRQLLLPPEGNPYTSFLIVASPEAIRQALGEPTQTLGYDGYGEEWYFSTPTNKPIGIAFRWQCARIRGKDSLTPDDVVQFIDWVKEKMND
jgi:hypothetical protein